MAPDASGDIPGLTGPEGGQLETVLFGPAVNLGKQQQDETSVLDAWHNWQTRIGKTNVQQIKNGHLALDNVANLIRTHR